MAVLTGRMSLSLRGKSGYHIWVRISTKLEQVMYVSAYTTMGVFVSVTNLWCPQDWIPLEKSNPLSMKSRTRTLDNLIGNKEPGNSIRAAMSSRVKTPIRPTPIPLQRNQPVLPHGGAVHWPRKRLYPNNEGAPGPCGSEFEME